MTSVNPLETYQEDAQLKQTRSLQYTRLIFPYMSLNQAIDVARAVRDVGGEVDRVAAAMRDRTNNSTFQLKASAARIFGLVDRRGQTLTLMELGERILDPETTERARVVAFLNVPLFSFIYETFQNRELPDNADFSDFLEREGVSRKQLGKARQMFRKSAIEAGFLREVTGDLLRSPVPLPSPRQSRWDELLRTKEDEQGPNGFTSRGPMLDALLCKLPEEGAEWSQAERDQWLEAARGIFYLVYRVPDQRPRSRSEN